MKLIYKLIDKRNDKNVFSVIEKEVPDIISGEILIKVKSCRTLDLHNDVIKELFRKCPRSIIPAALEVAGVITKIGENVSSLKVGDNVIGMLPVTSEWSGCAEYCVLNEYDAVQLPECVDYIEATSCVLSGLQAYTALQYMGNMEAGDVILVLDGATSLGKIVIQLAVIWGAKVITTVSTPDEKSLLERLKSKPYLVIVGNPSTVVNHIIEETGGLGVDIVIDNGLQLFPQEDDAGNTKMMYPTKDDIITLLAVGGRWITSCSHFQLDPPNSDQLLLRSASVSFLLPQTWILCPTKQGKLQHILQNFLQKLSRKEIDIEPPNVLSFKKLLEPDESELLISPGTVLDM